jgi:hypothetical protein
VVLGGVLSLAGCAPEAGRAVTAVDTVHVSINCYPDSTVAVALSPWIRSVPEGGTIEWVLAEVTTGIVDTFYIEPKPNAAGRWMYRGKPGGKPGNPGRSGEMNRNAKRGDRGHYNFVAFCRPAAGHPAFKILVDPDVIVD